MDYSDNEFTKFSNTRRRKLQSPGVKTPNLLGVPKEASFDSTKFLKLNDLADIIKEEHRKSKFTNKNKEAKPVILK